MSRCVKDLRELINISRLTVRESDDSEASDTDESFSSGTASATTPTSLDDSGILTGKSVSPPDDVPTSTKRRRKKRNRNRGGKIHSDSDANQSASDPDKIQRTDFDEMLEFLDPEIVTDWLAKSNTQLVTLSQWTLNASNFIMFANFWLSDCPALMRKDLIDLEYGILIDQLELGFASGLKKGKLFRKDLKQFLAALFWEYPERLLSKSGDAVLLNYLSILTAPRCDPAFKRLLSDVKLRTRNRQLAEWTLATRAFALLSVWCAVVNFFERVKKKELDQDLDAPELHLGQSFHQINCERIIDAIRLGYVDVVRYYISAGHIEPDWTDEKSRTLLFIAVTYNRPNIVRYLLTKVRPSPDANTVASSGNSCLHAAANLPSAELVDLLLTLTSANPNQCNTACDNATPLHLAIFQGCEKTVKMLLEAGADPTRRLGDDNALELAIGLNQQKIVTLLKIATKTK